jgi:hypothetical protein
VKSKKKEGMHMDQNQEMLELLRKIEKSGRQKNVTNILLCLFMLAAAVSCVALCLMVYRLLPQINDLLVQMEGVMGDLEQTARTLASLDLEGLASNVDSLTVLAQESLQQTMDKLNTIDIETLNKAIGDLAEVIEPLAKFFGMFG